MKSAVLVVGFLIAPALVPQASLRALQFSPNTRLAPGVILVANKKLEDPNFSKAVVLIADHSTEGTLGLILNRRTEMALSQALEQWKEAAKVRDPIFLGGPVGRTGMFALIRTKSASDSAQHIIGDIHLVTERATLKKFISDGPDRMRLYVGYTGWAPEQLESEIEEGGWHVMAPEPKLIFDPDPDTLWMRLSRLADMELAGRRLLLSPPPSGPARGAVYGN